MSDYSFITKELIGSQKKCLRLANYLSATQLYLKENFLLEVELEKAHIKKRILGHWGTVPGLNFIYSNLNILIKRHNQEMMVVIGSGHGSPAILSNMFLDGTLGEFYPEYKVGKQGIGNLIRNFSWPGGFPSHASPKSPGIILEGGELGYSLATAYGAAFDNKELIVACIIGDGESETGTLSASWYSNKFLNPQKDGAVLPVLHINKHKISGPTIYGTMSDKELMNLFKGYGYEPIIVQEENIYEDSLKVFEYAFQKIKQIQKEFRGDNLDQDETAGGESSEKNLKENIEAFKQKPVWPVILLKSKKGWTGPKELDGTMVEDSFRSHGIPLEDPVEDEEQFKLLEEWLGSYKVHELLTEDFRPIEEIKGLLPEGELRPGMNKHANNLVSQPLKLPEIGDYELEISGSKKASSMTELSKYLRDVIKNNPNIFRIMSPDESESNKLQSLFDVTGRTYVWPVPGASENISRDGRMMELLSENVLQAWLQGYILTGRHGVYISYEAFMMIIASMVDQYSKFLKQAKSVGWRKPLPSMNFIITSTGWRQDHNGYSHQNPGFISSVLNDYSESIDVHFPPDANSLLLTCEEALKSRDKINIIITGKRELPQYITMENFKEQMRSGISIWEGVGNVKSVGTEEILENQKEDDIPDIVFAATGDYSTLESISAIKILKRLVPEMRTRFVSISELSCFGIGDRRGLNFNGDNLKRILTDSKPVIYSYHGYPQDIKSLIFGHSFAGRISIHGYSEKGTTTTPFDMQVQNDCDRFHLALEAVMKVSETNEKVREKRKQVEYYINSLLEKHAKVIIETGEDIEEIRNFEKYF
ncbi:phosphoketolase family protein [Candidatus Dojkabacteria bacterium]|nr:phosphoketolase family protein [Candidatus Dojkabacteria bacterium]